MVDPVFAAAQNLADALAQKRQRIVFAESCTAGLVSATLARIAGISEWHCGAAVVYRLDTKQRWLGISAAMLDDPGPVSQDVAHAMAISVLERTPEANYAAAVTGHLGPNVPFEQDGLVWVAIAKRQASGIAVIASVSQRLLASADEGLTVRETRQRAAARAVFELVTPFIS